mmetsp:Transcript_74527/g.91581  ORF Transcript_74527/g.91581 Transcript_74527/m.91581 type:complete len:138 (-) Transcript_74527:118-531(-)
MSASEEKERKVSLAEQKQLQLALEQFQQGQQDIALIEQKINTLKISKVEAEQVIKILNRYPSNRRCWYTIDGVLVEQTITDCIPKLSNKIISYDKNIKVLEDESKTKNDLLRKFGIENGLIDPTKLKKLDKNIDNNK